MVVPMKQLFPFYLKITFINIQEVDVLRYSPFVGNVEYIQSLRFQNKLKN